MIRTVETDALRTGMFVILPVSWLKHPFFKSSFLLESEDQLWKIRESGLTHVSIDTDRGIADGEPEGPAELQTSLTRPHSWEPEKLVPQELREALRDASLTPGEKARAVYSASRELVKRLLEDPKARNIRAAKSGIGKVVDLIMADDATARSLLTITDHDSYTYTHSVNVGFFSVLLAKALFRNSDSHDMRELGACFFLHDIGKVRIDPAILNKPGRLTEEEMKQMRSHPYQGFKLLSSAKQLTTECAVIVMHHHERFDGTGYPNRLYEDDIHLYGRICSIADVYDALTAHRSYKQPLEPFAALKLMRDEMLGHFQRELFEKFVRLFA
jgi:HD-GYP domain-containing protein (c-di-GMP phosphodiesterase class II)